MGALPHRADPAPEVRFGGPGGSSHAHGPPERPASLPRSSRRNSASTVAPRACGAGLAGRIGGGVGRPRSSTARAAARAAAAAIAVLLGAAPVVPQAARAAEACADGWTAVGTDLCELEVTADGDVALPAGRTFDLLVVGGGGGGGGAGGDGGVAGNTRGRAGGGGGGEVRTCIDQDLSGTLTVTIGDGGAGSPGAEDAVDGTDGERTVVASGPDDVCVAAGGGGGRAGGSDRPVGADPWGDGGASGGGTSPGQAQWIGCTDPCDYYTGAGGGGGGAAAVGANASAGRGGDGGAGAGGTGLFTGDARRFGGGGGGGSARADLAAPAGGEGGGGVGSRALSSSSFDAAGAGTANTGGGGGGGSAGGGFRSDGAAGGTGVVLLRYDLTATVAPEVPEDPADPADPEPSEPSADGADPVLECDAVAPVGTTVTCGVDAGDAGISILWLVTAGDGPVATGGVVLDPAGRGTFTFVASTAGQLRVELVAWGASDEVTVTSRPVPVRISAGEAPSTPELARAVPWVVGLACVPLMIVLLVPDRRVGRRPR